MKFAKDSNWLWSVKEKGDTPPNTQGATLQLSGTAPLEGSGVYRITTAGNYVFTAQTNAAAGTLSLQVGPYAKSIDLSPAANSLIQPIQVGPGSHFVITAVATLAANRANQSKEATIEVDVPGDSTATPKSLEIVGPAAVSVTATEGTRHETYTFLQTNSDGTIQTGPLKNPAQGDFTYRTDISSENRVISEVRSGLTATKSVAVTYVPRVRVTLRANPVGAGNVTIESPNNSGLYDQGTTVVISATAGNGSNFESWSGGASGTLATMSVTADHDLDITGNFSASKFKLMALAAAGGTVSVNTTPLSTSADGYPIFAFGTIVTVVAKPDSSHGFASWDGPDGGSVTGGATGTILINGDKSIVANFDASSTYSLAVNVSDAAGGTANGAAMGLKKGDSAPVSVTLQPGWEIKEVAFTGTDAALTGNGTDNVRSVTIGSSDVTVTYVLQKSGVSLNLTSEGGGTVSGGGTYSKGDVADLVATPDAGYRFAYWGGTNGVDVSGGDTGSATPTSGKLLMSDNKTVTAVFTQRLATCVWSAEAEGGSGHYSITGIRIVKQDGSNTPVYSSQIPDASTTSIKITLPPGNYIITAWVVYVDDPNNVVTTTASLTVVDE
jgi:hypothetical protein